MKAARSSSSQKKTQHSSEQHKIALELHNEKRDNITKFLRDAGYEVHVENGENHLGMLYAKNPNCTKGMLA